MNFEFAQPFNNEEEKAGYLWINKIVKAQPEVVQRAYEDALTAAIRETYMPQKEQIPENEYMENIRAKLMDVFKEKIEQSERLDNIPRGFNKQFFGICLKTWVRTMNQREIINARMDINLYRRDNNYQESTPWEPDPNFLKQLSKALYEDGETTQTAFFVGNETGKLFDDGEIREIKQEIDRLKTEQKKEVLSTS
jgi:hypothetical protein